MRKGVGVKGGEEAVMGEVKGMKEVYAVSHC